MAVHSEHSHWANTNSHRDNPIHDACACEWRLKTSQTRTTTILNYHSLLLPRMSSSSSRFSIASLTDIFTLLVNTPMVPPPEQKPQDLELALTEMPPRRHCHTLVNRTLCASRLTQAEFVGHKAADNTSIFTTSSEDASASTRSSLDNPSVPAPFHVNVRTPPSCYIYKF